MTSPRNLRFESEIKSTIRRLRSRMSLSSSASSSGKGKQTILDIRVQVLVFSKGSVTIYRPEEDKPVSSAPTARNLSDYLNRIRGLDVFYNELTAESAKWVQCCYAPNLEPSKRLTC